MYFNLTHKQDYKFISNYNVVNYFFYKLLNVKFIHLITKQDIYSNMFYYQNHILIFSFCYNFIFFYIYLYIIIIHENILIFHNYFCKFNHQHHIKKMFFIFYIIYNFFFFYILLCVLIIILIYILKHIHSNMLNYFLHKQAYI